MTTKILCAVDDTEYSKTSVALAPQLAKAMNAELTLLAVNELMGGAGVKGGLSRLMLGSVSRNVVARAHCPVTVAR